MALESREITLRPHARQTRIRFEVLKYNDQGVLSLRYPSEEEALDALITPRSEDTPDLVWTRRYDFNNKYDNSEVQVLSPELRDLFRLKLGNDPRLHFARLNKAKKIVLVGPFESLLHRWDTLKRLADQSCDSGDWQELKKQVAPLGAENATIPDEPDPELTPLKTKEDLETSLGRVKSAPDVGAHLSAMETAHSSGTIHFNQLWTTFPPGELVYSTVFQKGPAFRRQGMQQSPRSGE
ncbi:hypothetical protein K458DRAFT_391641 [Lentithecium fluviatile CBS 122367]|uniref:DUF7025 domain-containing protein n=1 Tax=Lentithecium fluviatile CBS 122367 TaxID=1168545 RepID=A0A6G1IUY0_9PLEO|nr:hypothetical protein K458DRAFT_391641 [Lentithecium fluviatile CBS 122367]